MKRIAVLAVIISLTLIVPALSFNTSAESDDLLLLDLGNGQIYWYEVTTDRTLKEATEAAASDNSLSIKFESNVLVSLGGMGNCTIGSSTVSWRSCSWNGSSWEYQDQNINEQYTGTHAWAFYPDDIVPIATPVSKYVWTTNQGSSESTNISNSYGPNDPKLPVEWSTTYTTGPVDSGLLVAGDLLYHTTGGDSYGSGDNKYPWAYCLNRNTGEEAWKFNYGTGAGYEIVTPVLVGDMIIIPATSGQIHCLDRFTGELLWTMNVTYDPPRKEGGLPDWTGRTFISGPTTAVYDSGALYFGSADGKVYCYTISREGYDKVWVTEPVPGEGLGCMYYHAPTITSVNRERILFIGNYEGYILAMKASDGSMFWDTTGKQLVVIPGKGTSPDHPGSVGGISAAPDGMLLVSCTDGEMNSLTGFLVALKTSDGHEIWKINALMTSPVMLDDGFISYVSPAANGAKELLWEDGSSEEVGYAIYRFNYDGKAIWESKEYQWIKAPLTYADGVIYGMDYSTGYFYPTGGCVTGLNAETGTEIFRLLLEPFSMGSFSMVQPVIIDGKVYVGNDFGAVYCLSNIAGGDPPTDDEKVLETAEFDHWSWYAMAAVVVMLAITFAWFYRP